jgi:hypothetical protein
MRAHRRWARVWVDEAFAEPVSYTLYRLDEGCLVRRVRMRGAPLLEAPQPWGADGRPPAARVCEAMARLSRIPLFPFEADDDTGRDGSVRGVETFAFARSARLVWWERPAGWEALDDWHREVVEIFEAALPAATPPRR